MKKLYVSGLKMPNASKFTDENKQSDELLELMKLDIFDEKYIIATCAGFT